MARAHPQHPQRHWRADGVDVVYPKFLSYPVAAMSDCSAAEQVDQGQVDQKVDQGQVLHSYFFNASFFHNPTHRRVVDFEGLSDTFMV